MNKKKLRTIEKAYWDLIYSITPSEIISYIFDIKIEENRVVFENAQSRIILWDDYKKLVDSMYIIQVDGVTKMYVGDSNFMLSIVFDSNNKVLVVSPEWTPRTGSIIKSLSKDELLILVLKLLRNILLKENNFFNIIKYTNESSNNVSIIYKFKIGDKVFDSCTVWRFLMIDFSELPHKLNNIIAFLQSGFNIHVKLNFKLDCTHPEFIIPKHYTKLKFFGDNLLRLLDDLMILTTQKILYDKTSIEVKIEKVEGE